MASSVVAKLLKRPSIGKACSLPPLQSMLSFDGLHQSPFQSQSPNSSSRLPEKIEKEPHFDLSNHFFAFYPALPHLLQSHPIDLSNPNSVIPFKSEKESNFDRIFARVNLDLIPSSEMVDLDVDGDEDKDFVIRADSVKKKRKKKMNKHKLKKLRKRLRRKT